MLKYSRVFFAVILAHTLKSTLVFTPVSAKSAIDIDKDGKFKDRITINHLEGDREGYKAYSYLCEGKNYVNVNHVYFGERLLKVGENNMKCDYAFYIKVFWKGDIAPILIKFKYYSWSWAPYRLHFYLTPQLEWANATVLTIDETTEEGFMPLFKQKLDKIVSDVGEDELGKYKPFKNTKTEFVVVESGTGEESSDKKKYVLMVVVVVVFVVVASLVVFLVKFCLK